MKTTRALLVSLLALSAAFGACVEVAVNVSVTEDVTAAASATGSGGVPGSGGEASGSAGMGASSGGDPGSGGSGGSGGAAPFDLWSIQAFVDGAVYEPGVEVELLAGTDDTVWRSLAAESNDLWDGHTGYKPVLSTLANGEQWWDLAAGGPYTSWLLEVPGEAYLWTEEGSYAAWVYLAANDSVAHVAAAQWPETAVAENRVYLQKNVDPSRGALYTSRNGYSADNAAGQGGLGDRTKLNTALRASDDPAWDPAVDPAVDWAGWHFVRATVKPGSAPYACPGLGGSVCTDAVQIWVDEVRYNGPVSTPSPGYGDPAPAIHASTYPFSWGAHYVSNRFDGIGAIYVANGHVSDADWYRVMTELWSPF